MTRETAATVFLERQAASCSFHEYDYAPDGGAIGMQAAEALKTAPENVLKTLVVEIDRSRPVCVVAPVHQKLDLKKVAALFGGRNARMMNPDKAHDLSGYRSGGTSPFGMKTVIPVVMSRDAMGHGPIYVNAGHQGFVVRIAPEEAVRLSGAIVADVAV